MNILSIVNLSVFLSAIFTIFATLLGLIKLRNKKDLKIRNNKVNLRSFSYILMRMIGFKEYLNFIGKEETYSKFHLLLYVSFTAMGLLIAYLVFPFIVYLPLYLTLLAYGPATMLYFFDFLFAFYVYFIRSVGLLRIVKYLESEEFYKEYKENKFFNYRRTRIFVFGARALTTETLFVTSVATLLLSWYNWSNLFGSAFFSTTGLFTLIITIFIPVLLIPASISMFFPKSGFEVMMPYFLENLISKKVIAITLSIFLREDSDLPLSKVSGRLVSFSDDLILRTEGEIMLIPWKSISRYSFILENGPKGY